jgi:hypothetical protein
MENNFNKLTKMDSPKNSIKNNTSTIFNKTIKRKGNFKNNRFRSRKKIKNKKKLFNIGGIFGRPYSFYRMFASKHYLNFILSVRPNNVFATLKGAFQEKKVIFEEESENFDNTNTEILLPKINHEINIRKKAGDFDIKCSKKSIKSKVIVFLNKFISNISPKKVYKYSFLIITITAPKMLRKKILNTIYRSYVFKRFKGKRLILNINHKKIFNGCCPRKKIKKKRRKFRLFK